MAKNRNSKIKQSSQEIIEQLKKGNTVSEVIAMGYPTSTVKYYRRKIFFKRSYNRFVKKIAEYNRIRNTAVIHN